MPATLPMGARSACTCPTQSACTRHLRLAGTVLGVGGILFNWLETAWFGFHMEPTCDLEWTLDKWSAVVYMTGLFVLAIAWLRKRSED